MNRDVSPIQALPNIDRTTASQKLGPQITGQIFGQDAGKAFEVPYGNSGVAVIIGRVDAVHQGDPATANTAATAGREQMNESIAQDIQTMTQTGAMAAVKAKTFPAVADVALDVKPAGKGAASSSSSKAKP